MQPLSTAVYLYSHPFAPHTSIPPSTHHLLSNHPTPTHPPSHHLRLPTVLPPTIYPHWTTLSAIHHPATAIHLPAQPSLCAHAPIRLLAPPAPSHQPHQPLVHLHSHVTTHPAIYTFTHLLVNPFTRVSVCCPLPIPCLPVTCSLSPRHPPPNYHTPFIHSTTDPSFFTHPSACYLSSAHPEPLSA